MTKRILAGFLGVLVALLVLVVFPLGIKVSAQQRDDFRHNAQATARALASTEEERLGDDSDTTDRRGATAPSVDRGDGVVILGRSGQRLVVAGRPVGTAVVDAVRAHEPARAQDAVVVATPIGSARHPDGTVVLVRDSEPLDQRIRALWLALAAAGAVTLSIGAVIAAGLARWIGRPLRGLGAAATRMGHGDVSTRTDARAGPLEVRAVAAAFNEMAQRLGALLDSQRTMTADVSHQLRTPLAALQLRLELIAEDAPRDMLPELTDALREISRLNRLVDGLLAVARAEGMTAKPTIVDVANVVSERVDMWQPLAHERGVTLSLAAEPATALATPGHIEQVLDNLIANAMDAVSSGDQVAISIRSVPDEVTLAVADTGPGMPPARIATAFNRFEGDQSGRNSGLGLAIVSRLVATDRGSITLTETLGGGLTATVRLPSGAEHPVAATTPRQLR